MNISMKNSIVIVGALVVAILGVALFYFGSNKNITSAPAAGEGKVVFGISDAAMDIEGVSSIMMTVDSVEVQSGTQGWIVVSSSSKQYDLLRLKQSGAVAFLADINLAAGTYDQVRLTISKVLVNASGTIQEARLPSGTLKISGRIVVEEGETSTAVLDFKADKSLHMTGNGKFIMAPVINFKTQRRASVGKNFDETLKINGGENEDDVNVGMDVKGEIKNNFELDSNAKIEIDGDDVIHITGVDFAGDQNNKDKADQNNEEDRSDLEVKLNLSPQNNFNIGGTARFDAENGKVKVTLKLAVVPAGVVGLSGISLGAAHPAHIHYGSCANLGGVKYPLAPAIDGKSETTINASLADLKAGLPLAINVHKSDAETGVYLACADMKF